MIKKSVFEDELIAGMHQQLVKQAKGIEIDDLSQAVDHLNSAAQIFEDLGMLKNADYVLSILSKIGNNHTKDLTSEKMVENLKDHGTVFNMSDDNLADQEVEDTLEVSDPNMELHDFEDERVDDNFSEPLASTASLYSKTARSDIFDLLLNEQKNILNKTAQDTKIDEEDDVYARYELSHKKHIEKEKFLAKLKHELWLNTDDFDWKWVKNSDLESIVDFNLSIDDNVNKIGGQGIVPKKIFNIPQY